MLACCSCNVIWQIAVELLSSGDVWPLGIARKPLFSRTTSLPASMGETSVVRRVRLALGRVLHCKVRFRCSDRIVMAASSDVCRLGRRRSFVICKAVVADGSGTAAAR